MINFNPVLRVSLHAMTCSFDGGSPANEIFLNINSLNLLIVFSNKQLSFWLCSDFLKSQCASLL